MDAAKQVLEEKFSFTSSIAGDVWHKKGTPDAFEWWYFDALSDDGRDAVVIIFLDNFIFSPRYNAFNKKIRKSPDKAKKGVLIDEKTFHFPENKKFPALAFIYYRDGKPVYRAINEYDQKDFEASETAPACRIGESTFRLDSAPYGSGYVLSINAKLPKNRTLKANFECLAIEGDFTPECCTYPENSHCWNMVLARSDVTGRIDVEDAKGKNLDTINFRGTGYHDHNIDNRWLPETVKDWQWGRAHFADATAIFYRYKEIAEAEPITKLFVVLDGELQERNAVYEEQNLKRDVFGIKYPCRLTFQTEDNLRLRVKQTKVIDSSFFYMRFLSEMTLTLRDGKPRKTIGITEYLAPKALKYRWLDWLVSMRIGRKGKGSLLR
jgi:carotenoid 1,2-hydratase